MVVIVFVTFLKNIRVTGNPPGGTVVKKKTTEKLNIYQQQKP
jgi:hypothetical protein